MFFILADTTVIVKTKLMQLLLALRQSFSWCIFPGLTLASVTIGSGLKNYLVCVILCSAEYLIEYSVQEKINLRFFPFLLFSCVIRLK